MDKKIFKTPTEIEMESGRDFVEICEELLSKGYSTTEIALKLKLKHASTVSSTLSRKKYQKLNLEDEYTAEIKRKIVYRDRISFEEAFQNTFQISFEEYLYKKYIEEKHSQAQLGALLGVDAKTVGNYLKHYGIKKNLSEARRDAIDKGLINYGEIKVKARKTASKSLSLSNIQEWVRELFKAFLYETISTIESDKQLEVIIGFDEWGILKDKEVDLPIIIIIDNNNNTFLKYSIEFNHETWHNKKQSLDEMKAFRLTENGWRHFTIINKKSDSYANLEKQIRSIAKEIVNDILSQL
ncbi:hypothetical protein [Salinibacillus xinjiangensis]|uniref:Uncharacterized protein n=1 Tax=Salinibacillus xinjiangensis TaxID=1229268 RepID=A0A6G1X6U2_9BACI|nr:hypothetical protein [Salinibacillus xinjiangensis]MRG86723.1 hypothetical protein [Salinibacillus xinjiangensis]